MLLAKSKLPRPSCLWDSTLMNTAVQVCTKCNASLAMGLRLHFCPYCGTAQLEKKLLATKTTQNYDPSNPQHKPWRENPRLPKRNYTYGDSKKKQPWCPAMRQQNRRIGKKKFIVGADVGHDTTDPVPQTETSDNEEEDRNNVEEFDEDVEALAAAEAEERLNEPLEQFYTEKTWPIAVYDAEHWLAIGGMTVNLSLIEQSLGRATHNYWLRVGVMFDEDSAQSATSADTGSPSSPDRNGGTGDEVFDAGRAVESTEDEIDLAQPSIADAGLEQSGLGSADDSARGQEQVQGRGVEAERLYTLAVLSSDVAKWLIPRLDDWVELSAVDPMEYYMARHMERVLEAIAHRVVTANLNELAVRQTYAVQLRRKTKLSKLESTAEAVTGLPAAAIERFVKSTSTTTAAWGYNANQIVCTETSATGPNGSPKKQESGKSTGLMLSRTDTSLSVQLMDWVLQFSHLLLLTRGLSVRSYPATVRMSFRCADRLSDPTAFADTNIAADADLISLAEKEAAVAAQGDKYIDPRLAEKERRLGVFTASQRVTHAVLYIAPTSVSLEEVIPPAEMTFELSTLHTLLLKDAPPSWDEILAEGKKPLLQKLGRKLASLVRLEYTNEGIKYSVIGAFAEPAYISCSWPQDLSEYLDDDEDEELLQGATTSIRALPPEPVDPEALLDALVEPEMYIEPEVVGWSTPVPDEPSTPGQLTEQNSAVFPDSPSPEESAKQVVSRNSVLRWVCPFHATQTKCACVRKPLALKGSDLWVYVNACEPSLAHRAGASGAEEDTVEVPLDITLRDCLLLPCAVHCGSDLRLRAVDCTDDSLHCELHVAASLLSSVLEEAIAHSGRAHAAPGGLSPGGNGGGVAVYTVSSHNTIELDLTKHRALEEDLLTYLFASSHVDLFLSRKSRLLKLTVK